MIPSSLKQAVTVMRYELWRATKNLRLIGLLILVAVFSVLAAKGLEGAGNATAFGKEFFTVAPFLLIVIVGVWLGGDILASEFERKTGYMLFANPIKRVTVVAGKFMACFVSTLLLISVIYLIGTIFTLNNYGWAPPTILGSFGLAVLYGCAVLSLTFLFSSILGVAGATVISFSTLIVIMPILGALLLSKVGVEPWFLLMYSAGTIGAYIDPPAQRIVSTPTGTSYAYPDFTVSALVIIAYILVSLILCIIATKRREMR